MVIVTRLPKKKRAAGKHIGTWLHEQKKKGWSVEVKMGQRESAQLRNVNLNTSHVTSGQSDQQPLRATLENVKSLTRE